MKKFFSVKPLFQGVLNTSRRFPAALLACLAGTIIGYLMIHSDDPNQWINHELALSLAALMFIAIVLLGEAKKFSVRYLTIAHVCVLAFVVAYFFLLPDAGLVLQEHYIRHMMLSVGFVLVITFIPFIFQRGACCVASFWGYCRGLVVSAVLTGIWMLAFQAGLFIALSAIDFLFGIDIDEKRYAEIWITLIGIFAPLFFLSRVPLNPPHTEAAADYPKELRLFSQFVLSPLVCVYFLILYAYTIRVWVTGEWPDGQLAYMILGFSVLGVVAYLALYPLRERLAWVRHAGNALFIAMIPQVGMLFWALWLRVAEYGITENRYLVFVFGLWLLGVAIYFVISKSKDIRVIPISIFIIAILVSFGPWGAFTVSERSQIHRLEDVLIFNDLLVDGKYTQSSAQISDSDILQVSSIVSYLNQNHGLGGIQKWFDFEFDLDGIDKWSVPEYVLRQYFGLEFQGGCVDCAGQFYLFGEYTGEPINLEGYKYMLKIDGFAPQSVEIEGASYLFALEQNSGNVKVRKNGEEIGVISTLEVVNRGVKGVVPSEVHLDEMVVASKGEKYEAKLIVESISGTKSESRVRVDHLIGTLLFTPLP